MVFLNFCLFCLLFIILILKLRLEVGTYSLIVAFCMKTQSTLRLFTFRLKLVRIHGQWLKLRDPQ